jgi:tetratricopeptide (TPR) repeat protein
MLMRAQQAFPDDAEMFEIEARLWSEMKDKTKALRALERAWRKMPRGSGTAIRIGKIYAKAGRRPDELKVLTEALDRNPEDKAAHYAMAIHLLGDNPINRASVIHHLGSSFQVNDANLRRDLRLHSSCSRLAMLIVPSPYFQILINKRQRSFADLRQE